MAKAKWKELPQEPDKLRELLQKLKDKEMRLEADLAIKERPDFAEVFTKLALALAEVKKLDNEIHKSPKPGTLAEQEELMAIVARIEHYSAKLQVQKDLLIEKGGKGAEKFVDMKLNRASALTQLRNVYRDVERTCATRNLDLGKIMPSLSDYLEVCLIKDETDRQVDDMADPPHIRKARAAADRLLERPSILEEAPDADEDYEDYDEDALPPDPVVVPESIPEPPAAPPEPSEVKPELDHPRPSEAVTEAPEGSEEDASGGGGVSDYFKNLLG